MRIYPVIHFLNRELALKQAMLAQQNGADGIFLISHLGDNEELCRVAWEAKQMLPTFEVGINLLSWSPRRAAEYALLDGLDMVWADDMGVNSQGLTSVEGGWLSAFAGQHPHIKLFASVAFKYQPHEPDPALAARNAQAAGFIPTTSGSGTGSAPAVTKIAEMSAAVDGNLAVASGMTPENVAAYAPNLRYILVATGISIDDHRMDADKLRQLIAAARQTKERVGHEQ